MSVYHYSICWRHTRNLFSSNFSKIFNWKVIRGGGTVLRGTTLWTKGGDGGGGGGGGGGGEFCDESPITEI